MAGAIKPASSRGSTRTHAESGSAECLRHLAHTCHRTRDRDRTRTVVDFSPGERAVTLTTIRWRR